LRANTASADESDAAKQPLLSGSSGSMADGPIRGQL
jgi:hypothetical protein